MEIRTLLLTLNAAVALPGLCATPVQRYPLDDRAVYTVRVGVNAPSTVMFPGPIAALDGAGVSATVEDQPALLLSHQAGTRFFSVRALRAGAAGAANVIYRDRVYAFAFTSEGEPDRTITFVESSGGTGPGGVRPSATEHLLARLDEAKHFAGIAAQYPALVQHIEHRVPAAEPEVGAVSAVIEEVFRFTEDGTLVFRVRLQNRGPAALHYSAAHLGITVGATLLPCALTDACGVLPAARATILYLAVRGHTTDTAQPVSITNPFGVLLPPMRPVE